MFELLVLAASSDLSSCVDTRSWLDNSNSLSVKFSSSLVWMPCCICSVAFWMCPSAPGQPGYPASSLRLPFDDLFSHLPFVWPVDGCKRPHQNMQMPWSRGAFQIWYAGLLLFFFLRPLNSMLNNKTRLEWIVTTKRGSNLCYQPVVRPAGNKAGNFWFIECELTDKLERLLT